MDIDTSNAIERLSDRIDGVSDRIEGVNGRIDGVEVSLRAEIHDVRDQLRAEIGELRDQLRAEFRDGLAANRTHTEVLFESLKDDIRIVAEGVAALTIRFDRRFGI